MKYIGDFWKNMMNYRGKTSRKAYWIGLIGNGLILWCVFYSSSFLLGFIGELMDADFATLETMSIFIFIMLYGLLFFSGISCGTRRLRDTGYNPWFILGSFVPGVNLLVFMLFLLPSKSKAEANRQGEVRHDTK